jgi:hypothetical protein
MERFTETVSLKRSITVVGGSEEIPESVVLILIYHSIAAWEVGLLTSLQNDASQESDRSAN